MIVACLIALDAAVGVRHFEREIVDLPRGFDAGVAAADHDDGEQARLVRRIGFDICLLEAVDAVEAVVRD